MSFSTVKPLSEISAAEIQNYISVLTNELVRRVEGPPPSKKVKKVESLSTNSTPGNGKVGMFPCADANCPKHDLIYTDTVIYNRDPEEEDVHKRFSCCTKTCIVYGILCLHPNCTKQNQGRPLLIYVGQTAGGALDRIFRHMDGIEMETGSWRVERVQTHFRDHWAELSEGDKEETTTTKLWFRFVVFDQFLSSESEEIDNKERELIQQFDLQSKNGCNEQPEGKKRSESILSTSSKIPIRAQSTAGGSSKTIALPFHTQYLIALALKNSEDGQMMAINIFDYIETNFGKLFTSYGIKRNTLSTYFGKNCTTGKKSEVPLHHRTDWFRKINDSASGNSPGMGGFSYAFIQEKDLMTKINEDLFAFLRNETNQKKLKLLMDNPSCLPDHLDFLPLNN